MGTLSYTTSMSLDGYVADASGDFNWAEPSAEVFQFHIDRMNSVAAEVVGRHTYLLMKYWESAPEDGSWGEAEHEFARRWQQIDRVVASSTLSPDSLTPGVRLVRDLSVDELSDIAASAPGEVEIFGPTTAAAAIRAGLVRDIRLLIVPLTLGGGLPALPEDARLNLTLTDHRTFDCGTVYVHYVVG